MLSDLLPSTISGIRKVANRNRNYLDPMLSLLGKSSDSVELLLRRTLTIAPQVVSLRRSPTGAVLDQPIMMRTVDGRDQVARGLYYRGWAFEWPMPALIEAGLRLASQGAFLDIGANTGIYSILSKAVAPQREVYAFEPLPLAIAKLRDNIGMNPFAADIVLAEIAASDLNGTAELYVPTQEHGLIETSASLESDFRSKHSEVLVATTMTTDGYCLINKISNVAVCKIDVEGAENKVIDGCTALLDKMRPIIFCEILPTSNSWPLIARSLKNYDYGVSSIWANGIRLNIFDPEADNHILFPKESEKLVVECAGFAGVEVSKSLT